MIKLFKVILASLCLLALFGFSTMLFTNAEQPFDGTVHATSSLICSGYLSNRDPDGCKRGRSVIGRVFPTIGLVVYGSVDLISTIVFDAFLYIPQRTALFEPHSPTAADRIPHSLLPCGTLNNSSIKKVLYIT